jgi:hypothetical protein
MRFRTGSCSDQTTHPLEADGPARGVWDEEINPPAAVMACEQDLAAHPDDPVVNFHLGRALDVAGRGQEARLAYLRASEMGFPLADLSLAWLAARTADTAGIAAPLERAQSSFETLAEAGNPAGMIGFIFASMMGPDGSAQLYLPASRRGQYLGEAARAGYAEVMYRQAMRMRRFAELNRFNVGADFQNNYFTLFKSASYAGHPEASMVVAEKAIESADYNYRQGGVNRSFLAAENLRTAKVALQAAMDGGIAPERTRAISGLINEIETRDERAWAEALGMLVQLAQKEIESGAYARRLNQMSSGGDSTYQDAVRNECEILNAGRVARGGGFGSSEEAGYYTGMGCF